jgi:carbon-monoxide dehydrogenase small subunit
MTAPNTTGMKSVVTASPASAGPSARQSKVRSSASSHPADGTWPLSLTVNGHPVNVEIEPRTLLVELLREKLRLTGTHVGCDTGQCGACTVHLDGRAVKSCTLLGLQAQGAEVTTIEGVAAEDGALHPMQAAFRTHHGLQCGFCTPGMVMNAIDLVRDRPDLGEAEVRHALDGNLCRCTGYHNIVKAVLAGAKAMRGEP